MQTLLSLLSTGLLETTPILLAALGGAINREAGIVNLGLDGMMLAGAFVAVYVDWQAGSPLLACLAAVAAGAPPPRLPRPPAAPRRAGAPPAGARPPPPAARPSL